MRTLVTFSALALACLLPRPAAADEKKVDFNREIRPILSNTCFACHGPDAKKREADLRLDTKEGLFAETSGGRTIVPGKSAESEIYRHITATDPDERMPPPKAEKQLTPEQVALIGKWIDQGAGYSSHWSFAPPARPALPPLRGSAWVRNPIDAFVLARLEREGLAPSPEADRVTVARRLALDLVGLPPTIAEVDEFQNDHSGAAYERLVQRLLDSPHYGERWGRHWLDAARYADSDGYEKDKSRQVHFYRDWVIAALNRDLGYDQFIVQQIAGDLLPGAGQDERVATGYLRNSMINEEGGIDPEQFRMEAMFDRMDAIGKGVLGLTIGCAQCHSHKYDPLTQEEYYRMFAFLNDCHEANLAVYTAAEQQQRAELFERVAQIEADLQHRHPDWTARMAAWEDSARADQPSWTTLNVRNQGENAQRYVYHADGSQTAWGYAPTKWTSEFRGRSDLPRIAAIRLELLCDDNLPLGGPGRSPIGLCALSELTVEAADADKPDQRVKIKLVSATADFGNRERDLEAMFDDRSGKKRIAGPVAMAIDGKDDTAWGIDAGPGRRNVPRQAVFIPERPIEFPKGAVLTFHLKQNHGGWNSDDNQNNNLGRFRFSVTGADGVVADVVPARVRQILSLPRPQRSAEQTAAVFAYWRTTVPEWQSANEQIEALWQRHPLGASQLTLAAREMSRSTSVLSRGDFLKPVKEVSGGVPAFLHPLPAGAPASRLTFARWLVDRQSPTTARALVNRVWQAYFGAGLVTTPEELGSQGELPSHPELLDWLAVEFMEHGWSLKWLHRQIVGSATYRQSSKVRAELLSRDPYNRLLARGPRQRVEGEIVRDIALAASGLLNRQVGGPPVYPPAPEFLFQPPVSYGPKVWREERGDNRYRRALYTFRYRSVPYPMLQNFDTPNGDSACVRRPRSNTPLQALTTLNEPLFLECAQALARRAVCEGGAGDAARLAFAFRCCLGRSPSEAEARLLADLLAKQTRRFASGEADPQKLLAARPDGAAPMPPGVSPAQLAGWTAVARVLLNLDETISKE